MLQPKIRQATSEDIPFLIKAIIEAEKSGSEKISYCTLFGLSEEALIKILTPILLEDLEGQQLCISGFYIALIKNRPVATCCSWIEGQIGMKSSIITGSLLGEYLPKINFEEGVKKNELLKGIHIERKKEYLQIESVYTVPEFRGNGLIRKLIQYHVLNQMRLFPQLQYLQIIIAETNATAFTAYQKLGFQLKQKAEGVAALLQYLPSNVRLSLETSVNLFI